MSDFHFELGNTHYGEELMNNARFDSYRPSFMSVGEYEELLGADVNNYNHMPHMVEITGWYIDRASQLGEPLSYSEQDRLILTAWVHDIGEAIHGDIPDPLKVDNEFTRQQEREDFITVATEVYNSPEQATALADEVIPIMQRQEPLGEVWRAIEVIGYHKTAMKAGQVARHINTFTDVYRWNKEERAQVLVQMVKMHDEVVAGTETELSRDFANLIVIQDYLAAAHTLD